MNDDFRTSVSKLGKKAAEIMEGYFDGKVNGSDKVSEASKMIGQAIKIEHIDQIKDQSNRSFALRLLNFLPADPQIRKEYIRMTNPQLKPLLLDKPSKR